MPLAHDGPAPYAPPAAVLTVIDAFRNRGLSTPITTDVLMRAGVQESLAPRTLSSLKLLELVNEAGEPTDHFQALRKVPSEEYRARFAEFVREIYAEVFNFVDPANDPIERISDAFRGFTPHGQRERMVTLFLGLCDHAEVITGLPTRSAANIMAKRRAPAGNAATRTVRAPRAVPEVKHEPATRGQQTRNEEPQNQLPSVHPLLDGLFKTLPPVGSVWAKDDRQMWADAALANFSLLYKLAPDERAGGDGD